MSTTLRRFIVLAVSLAAATGMAQEVQLPSGKWQSAANATYTNPALTGAELYLSIDVAKDGSFQGKWGQYLCNSYPGAYGISIYSSSRIGSNRVSGKFGPDRGGVIDLEKLRRSAFTWAAPSADELALDLPKNWQGGDAILYRARLTRDGKGKPAAATGPAAVAQLGLVRSPMTVDEIVKFLLQMLAYGGGSAAVAYWPAAGFKDTELGVSIKPAAGQLFRYVCNLMLANNRASNHPLQRDASPASRLRAPELAGWATVRGT